jgi:hypothetical protein
MLIPAPVDCGGKSIVLLNHPSAIYRELNGVSWRILISLFCAEHQERKLQSCGAEISKCPLLKIVCLEPDLSNTLSQGVVHRPNPTLSLLKAQKNHPCVQFSLRLIGRIVVPIVNYVL